MATNLDLMGIGAFNSEQDAYRALLKEGKKLEDIARRVWRQYEASYKPKEYIRTGNSMKALKLKTRPRKDGVSGIMIELTWENDLVWHDSWLHKKGKVSKNQKGHSIILISMGWHAKKLEKVYKKSVYRHTYYEGYGYLTKVIQAYNAVKDPRISLELEIADKLLTGKRPIK